MKTAPGHVGDELLAVAEMPVWRGRAHPGPARRLGKREPTRAFLRDQYKRSPDQCLLEVAVVVAARARGPGLSAPTHVNSLYISCAGASTNASSASQFLIRTHCPAQWLGDRP